LRYEKIVRIEENNRDHGKHFKVTEMSAWDLEKWARDALIVLARSGVDIGDVAPEEGFAGIMRAGTRADVLMQLKGEDLEPLMDRMLLCVQFISDPKHPDFLQPLKPEDIEELSTIMRLRTEVMRLHQNFSLPGAQPGPASSTLQTMDQNSLLTRTSQPQSAPSSRRGRRR